MRFRIAILLLSSVCVFLVSITQFSIQEKANFSKLTLTQIVQIELINLERNLLHDLTNCQAGENIATMALSKIEKFKKEYPVQFKADQNQLTKFVKKIEDYERQVNQCRIQSSLGMNL